MNVLLIGGAGYVVDTIINKLNKEGHRVFVLTGRKYAVGKYKNVYEKYHFEYDSECIKEVFDSINPDVTVFTGAFDPVFDWSRPTKESVKYTAGLINTIMAFSLLKHGRFLYLSSEEVYGVSYAGEIPEQEAASAESLRGMALAQGESVCINYQQALGLDIVILRLDHLLDLPRNKGDVRDVCSWMCLEALKNGKIAGNAKITLSMLFISDAAEFIYKIVAAGTHQHVIYNIGSGEPVNEIQLAELVQTAGGSGVTITDNTGGSGRRIILSNARFREEFGLLILNHPQEIVHKIISHMKKHLNAFVEPEDEGRGFFGKLIQRARVMIRALIPFVENVVCFLPFFMINNRAVGSAYFANLDIYLIYVLLFAIIYGQQQATLSGILAVAGYCFRQMYSRSGVDVLTDYNTYVWIGHLFILGLVVGYMRDRLKTIKGEDEIEIKYLSDQLYNIQDINTNNVRIKNILETQIVNQNDSIGKIYEVVSTLDKYETEEVLFQAAEVLSRLMNSKDVTIYTVAGKQFARIVSSTSPKARELGNTIRYTELEEMYAALKQKRVFINRKLDNRYPLMASAIYSEEEMQLILMVWGIPWERMTLSQANRLVVIGDLIQNAVIRANRYMEALKNRRYLEGTNILGIEAFTSLVKAYISAGNKGLAVSSVLRVEVPDHDLEKAGKVLGKNLRETDYLGELGDGNLYALLSNTNKSDAEIVKRRFQEAGYASIIPEELAV